MSGDPAPPRLMLPTCCPFHESGGTWDSGHREQRVGGFYGGAHVGSIGVKDINSVGQREGESLNDAITRSIDLGGGIKITFGEGAIVKGDRYAFSTGADARRFGWINKVARYPGEGNRLARRAAAKGRERK